eukprot:EG_transcript_525
MHSQQSGARPLPLGRPLGRAGGGASWASRPTRGPPQPTSPISPSNAPLLRSDQLAMAGRSDEPWDSAPKRPRASSWEEPVKGQIIEMVDVELEETHGAAVIDEEPVTKKDEARQMAQAMGAEKLFDAYHRLVGAADAPLGKLFELFQAAGLPVPQEEVDEAIEELCPEASGIGHISYKQCQELYLHLQQQHHKAEAQDQGLAKTGRFARWMAGLSDKQATNALLVVVVTLCCVSAFLAGGLAILLLVLDDTTNMNNFLQENLYMIQDTVEVYAGQIAVQEGNDRATMFIATMASILQNVAFYTTLNANTAQLSRVMISVTTAISSWLLADPWLGNLAPTSALLANASLAYVGLNRTVALLNQLNNGLPDGYELLLGQLVPNSSAAVKFLTRLRYAAQCNGTCPLDGAAAAPMQAALAGNTGGSWGADYRGQTTYTGYSPAAGFGVQLNVNNLSTVTPWFNEMVVLPNAWTADPANTWEFMLGQAVSPGVNTFLSTVPGCDAACGQRLVAPGTPLARAINGETGATTYINFRGVKSVVAYAPVPRTNIGVAIHMSFSDIVLYTLKAATALIDNLNLNYPQGSEEFELTSFVTKGNATNFTRLSAFKYGDQCPSGRCTVATPYVRTAAKNCSQGVMRTADYRGTQVLVGYACISEVSAVLSFKLDMVDVDADLLAAVVAAVDDRNGKDADVPAEFLAAKPKTGLTAAQVQGYGDFDVVSQLKHPEDCVNANCTWNRESALRALQNLKDVVDNTDYRGMRVMAAAARSSAVSYGVGLAVEQDKAVTFQPMVDTILKVAIFTGAMVVGSTVVLILMTKLFLRTMIKAKEEGNKVVVVEKERFSKLVSSMYPKFVLPQLLEGDKQLVCEVPGAAVFFSDIHEFTSASNTLSSEELLRLMGYVYGVMDFMGDSFGVYKVKTIGDAYLAVRGLPGSDSENPSLELLRYASFVLQVFGDRFVHPTEGQVLAIMNKAMMWSGGGSKAHRSSKSKGKGTDESSRHSVSPSISPSQNSRQSGKSASVAEAPREEDQVQCIMSYGLAVGKIVAGVLAGRCPMFDIWGATVNLASRMQSSGEPGRIQVSEQLYKKVMAVPGQPFTFEAPRSTFCKGFGNVSAYMVRTTKEGLPKDLQEQLRLEPRFNAFRFDNILTSVSNRNNVNDGPSPRPGVPPLKQVGPSDITMTEGE